MKLKIHHSLLFRTYSKNSNRHCPYLLVLCSSGATSEANGDWRDIPNALLGISQKQFVLT